MATPRAGRDISVTLGILSPARAAQSAAGLADRVWFAAMLGTLLHTVRNVRIKRSGVFARARAPGRALAGGGPAHRAARRFTSVNRPKAGASLRVLLPFALALTGTAQNRAWLDLLNHGRPVLDAHNCYPHYGQRADRIDRALSLGFLCPSSRTSLGLSIRPVEEAGPSFPTRPRLLALSPLSAPISSSACGRSSNKPSLPRTGPIGH